MGFVIEIMASICGTVNNELCVWGSTKHAQCSTVLCPVCLLHTTAIESRYPYPCCSCQLKTTAVHSKISIIWLMWLYPQVKLKLGKIIHNCSTLHKKLASVNSVQVVQWMDFQFQAKKWSYLILMTDIYYSSHCVNHYNPHKTFGGTCVYTIHA